MRYGLDVLNSRNWVNSNYLSCSPSYRLNSQQSYSLGYGANRRFVTEIPGNNNIIELAFKLSQAGVIDTVSWDTDGSNKRWYKFIHRGAYQFLSAAQAKPYFEALVREHRL